jgi:hypothetical protein
MMRLRSALWSVAAACLCLAIIPSRAADTLPAELSDATYWKMISDFSEPDGPFMYQVVTSNETAYQMVLPELTKSIAPAGGYFGVGPEQNFTYIAALRPKIAFIIDVRRDMMLEHLMYKAVFEMSKERADFVGNLFSRKRPAELTEGSSVEAIFKAYASIKADTELAEHHLADILARLKTAHKFALSENDEKRIRAIYMLFFREGVVSFFSSIESPGYTYLMTATDLNGKNWSFLASNENYDRVRAMQEKNLIVPLVGDFAGPKAIRMAGQYLRDHGAVVKVFYTSNVEDYIQHVWSDFTRNVASLPLDEASVFVRTSLRANGFRPWLTSMTEFVAAQRVR